jgi:hypothetical protein
MEQFTPGGWDLDAYDDLPTWPRGLSALPSTKTLRLVIASLRELSLLLDQQTFPTPEDDDDDGEGDEDPDNHGSPDPPATIPRSIRVKNKAAAVSNPTDEQPVTLNDPPVS